MTAATPSPPDPAAQEVVLAPRFWVPLAVIPSGIRPAGSPWPWPSSVASC
jgi:hypothetical protein